VPQERSASPDLESLRPVLGVMTEIQARYVVDLHQAGGPAPADLPARLALAVERGAEAVASGPANPVLAGQQALAFGAAVWSALTALPDHSANEHKRLLKAAYAAYDQHEAGADAAGLNAALESTGRAAALAAGGDTPTEEATASLADELVAALAAVTASAAVLDPSLTGEPGGGGA
jgi:hypothetical protein